VEVLSPGTRRRDLDRKRAFYTRVGVAEYWIVDQQAEIVIQIRGEDIQQLSGVLHWSPPGTPATLEIDVARMFADIRSRMA
jgi:Uma2 family endonuclease